LEKLEALIKEGALVRQGRPLSGEGVEMSETLPPLAFDVPPPAEDIPPLMPMKGTLRRSAHTSMRNVRRGGLAAVRTSRRSSEPKKGDSRISQGSASEEDGMSRLFEPLAVSSNSLLHERGELIPMLDAEQDRLLPSDDDKSRTSTPAILEKSDLQNLVRPTSDDIVVSGEPIFEEGDVVLGQIQPRQLRRPPLRRQALDAESLSLAPTSPTNEPQLDKPFRKSPVSPLFPPPPPPVEYSPPIPEKEPPPPPTQQYQPIQSPPAYVPYQLPVLSPTESPAATTQSKKGAWSRLFTSSSDDEQTKERVSNRGKPKKFASYHESPKSVDQRMERRSSDLDRAKSLLEASSTSTFPPAPSASPPPPPPAQKQPSKKESGIFASIFGSKKKSESKDKQSKSHESSSAPQKSSAHDRSQYQRHGPAGWTDQGNAISGPPVLNFYYTRFPIHVERAIYRLSHIKLANPRRPLLQQVLLSNFMYGYLNLINKAAQPQQQEIPQHQQGQQESFVEQSPQTEDHVFYSADDQNDYYGQDYYGAEYDDDQDEVTSIFRVVLTY
jgi:Activator of mitotic machinery Cdc14 phosphatase activation C-term